jgi:hypothetical protein
MVGKLRMSRAAWLTHVSDWKQSGLSQAACSQHHGLAKSSFNKWIHDSLHAAGAQAESGVLPKMISVTVKEIRAGSGMVLRGPHGWELNLPSEYRWVNAVFAMH